MRFVFALFVFFITRVNFATQEILDLLSSHLSIPSEVIEAANLTTHELATLPDVRWRPLAEDLLADFEHRPNSAIPPGVKCQIVNWCDDIACTQVCKSGSLELDQSFRLAIKSQVALSRELPLCYAQWLGTHNSAITLTNGYGNRDLYYTQLLKLTKWDKDVVFETFNQFFALTDQLNLGTRMIELDVHWVKDDLRIAHCGGLTNAMMDYMATLINTVAKLLGKSFRWDTETIGCYPSASSIKATDQTLLVDAMKEIVTWLKQEENKDEFLVIYLDDQHDLADWGLLPTLKEQLVKHVPEEWIFTPVDQHLYTNDELPSANLLVDNGKRIMFISSSYYANYQARNFLFYASRDGRLCKWEEPHMDALDLKHCTLPTEKDHHWVTTMTGTITRLQTCEIQYGPLSCALRLHDDDFPSPDRLTPQRAKSAIWSWAPGEPKITPNDENSFLEAVISAEDGFWRLRDPNTTHRLPVVCAKTNSTLHYSWELHQPLENGNQSICHNGTIPAIPRHGKENSNLQKEMKKNGVKEARILGVYNHLSDITPHFLI